MRAALMLFAVGCGAVQGAPDAGVDAGLSHDVGALASCAQSQAQPLGTIAAVVDRLNALPQPQTIACFVAGLPRPLDLVGTLSETSAQPAAGAQSPRLFILEPGIALSVVGSGDGAHLLELGEWVTAKRTLKGEIELPFTGQMAHNAPFTRVKMGGATTCGLCHRFETPDPSMNGGFVSLAFKPAADTEVSLAKVSALHAACVESHEVSDRCALMHAVFDFGEARQGAFAPEVERFIQ